MVVLPWKLERSRCYEIIKKKEKKNGNNRTNVVHFFKNILFACALTQYLYNDSLTNTKTPAKKSKQHQHTCAQEEPQISNKNC